MLVTTIDNQQKSDYFLHFSWHFLSQMLNKILVQLMFFFYRFLAPLSICAKKIEFRLFRQRHFWQFLFQKWSIKLASFSPDNILCQIAHELEAVRGQLYIYLSEIRSNFLIASRITQAKERITLVSLHRSAQQQHTAALYIFIKYISLTFSVWFHI